MKNNHPKTSRAAYRTAIMLGTVFSALVAAQADSTLVVNAGSPQTITLPASAIVNGTVSDALSFTTAWSELSYVGTGAGVVSFYDPTQLTTLAQFSDPGTYVLQLTATDSQGSAAGNVTITVNAPTPVTGQPTHVTVNGSRLMVAQNPYTIQGVTYDPATQAPATGPDPITGASVAYGFFFDDAPGNRWRSPGLEGHDLMKYWLKQEFLNHYAADIALMAQMKVNTVRLYSDLGDNTAAYQQVLDAFHQNGIMVIMTVVGSKQDIDSGRYLQVVQMCKNHPAILMWLFGNEFNFNNLYGYTTMASAIAAINQAAANVKVIDPNHPVSVSLGDKFALNPPGPCGPDNPNSDIPSIVSGAPNIDIWGVNVYRGFTFTTFFAQWSSVTNKPFYFGEFGTDSFATTQHTTPYNDPANCVFNSEAVVQAGAEDQATQATFDTGLWQEIVSSASAVNASNNCAGGLVHTFNDPLWQVGNFNVNLGNLPSADYTNNTSYNTYNPDGFEEIGSQPDNVSNEEYYGLVDANRNPKQVFQSLKAFFANQPPTVSACTPAVNPCPAQTVTLPAPAALSGTATDDGLPFGTLGTTWTVVSAPVGAQVIFSSMYTPTTNAQFSAPGSYVLRLTADDGLAQVTSDISVTANSNLASFFTYYVDPAGSDNNDGLTPQTAFQTVAKVNSLPLQPGQSVGLESGGVWRESLILNSGGSSGIPIVIGAYGTGAAPVISGADLITGWTPETIGSFTGYSASQTTAFTQVLDNGQRLQQVSGPATEVVGSWWYDTVGKVLHLITANNTNPATHVIEASTRTSLWIGSHDITVQNIALSGGMDYNVKSSISAPTNNISIIDDIVANAFVDNIRFDNPTAYSGLLINGCSVYGAGANGILVEYNSSSPQILNNQVWGNSQLSNAAVGGVVDQTFSAGIKLYGGLSCPNCLSGAMIENNNVYQNTKAPWVPSDGLNNARGNGIWFDTVLVPAGAPATVRNNLIHDNASNGIYFEVSSEVLGYNNTLYNNSSYPWTSDLNITADSGLSSSNNSFYNNTVYTNGFAAATLMQTGGGTITSSSMTHNIWSQTTSGNAFYIENTNTDTVDQNCYAAGPLYAPFLTNNNGATYGTLPLWQQATGMDVHSVNGDPQFMNPTGRNFSVPPGSLCAQMGVAPAPPTLTLTKSANAAMAKSGDAITFTIQYQNTGASNAANAIISDAVPSGTTLVPNSISSGGTNNNGTIQWNLGTVAPGPAQNVNFQVQVN